MAQAVLEFREVVKRGVGRAKEVMDGKYEATFIRAVDQLRARKLGVRIMELLKMQNDDEWDCFCETQAASLEAKPYPTLDAIQNVFALALKRDREIHNFNPLALWDLHYLREIDDSGIWSAIRVSDG